MKVKKKKYIHNLWPLEMAWISSEMLERKKSRGLMIRVGDRGMEVNIGEWC